MSEVFRMFSSITSHSRLQPVEQVAHYRQSVVSIRHSSKSVAGDSLRSFSSLIFLDRLVAGLLVHTQVLLHRRLAWDIGRTVFADSCAQSILQQPTVQVEGDDSEVMWWDQMRQSHSLI